MRQQPLRARRNGAPVLYFAQGDDPKTLDPSVTYTVSEAAITDLIYPSYFQYHYLKRDPYVLELALGAVEPKREPYCYTATEKGKAVQKTGESWTFRIKPGLRFQDDPCFPGGKGREITAADFLYSFRRLADPSVHCPILSFVEDKIIGMKEYVAANTEKIKKKQKVDLRSGVEGLQLDPKDPLAFRVLLNQPYPQLRYLMAMHFTTPQLARHPVGSGAYMMEEYKSKQRIVLTANPNRREEFYPTEGEPGDRQAGLLRDAGKRLPLAEKVVFNIIREGVTGWNLFLQGYQDAWSVTPENYQQVMSRAGQLSPEMQKRGVQLSQEVSANIYYFAFNMKDSVVGGLSEKNKKLRQAISLAIDAQAFIDLFSQGNGQPAEFLIPPGIYGYDPNYRNPYRRYDPKLTRAKELLAEAGYPGGIEKKTGERLTLFFDNTATTAAGRQLVGLVTKQIQALGLRLESRSARSNVFQDRVDKGQFQFIRYGWFADYPDPENFVFLLYGPNKRPGPNASGYDNPRYNRLFEQMRALEDGPKRLEVIRQMRDIAAEDAPWVFLQHDVDLALTYDWLNNVKPHPVANDTTKYRGVDGERRAQLQRAWNQPNFWPLLGALALLLAGSVPAAAVVRARGQRRARRAAPVAASANASTPPSKGEGR